MENLKFIAVSVLAGTFVFSLFYLVGAFVQTAFDISRWTIDARMFTGIFGGLFGIIAVPATFVMLKMDDEAKK